MADRLQGRRADDDLLDFFTTYTGNPIDAAKKAGVGQYVALSVVGCARLRESGYSRAKGLVFPLRTECHTCV